MRWIPLLVAAACACAMEPIEAGTAIYTATYGDFQPGYKPAGC